MRAHADLAKDVVGLAGHHVARPQIDVGLPDTVWMGVDGARAPQCTRD
jgi:hypothetical protein